MAEEAETPVKATGQETSSETGEYTHLKTNLQGLMHSILKEDDCSIDMVIKSIRILSLLMVMKLKQSVGTVPGSVQESILHWCEEHDLAPLQKVDRDMEEPVIDRYYVNSLLEKLSSLPYQKEAAKELHRLTKTMPSCRAVFSEIPGAITRLLNQLSVTNVDSDPELQEDLIATVLNISTVDNNKKFIAEHPLAIPLLDASMRSGTIATSRNAAATLYTLSTLNSNKQRIGNSGALETLLELLSSGHPLAVRDAVSAIFSLCHLRGNAVRFIESGGLMVIITKLKGGILVRELLSLLALLSRHPDTIDFIKASTTFPQLIDILTTNRSEANRKSIDTILCNVTMS